MPYRARLDERTLLNLPGFHGGAYVYVYVEDTTDRTLQRDPYCDDDCTCCPYNFEPRMSFEIGAGDQTVALSFDVDKAEARVNSFHKLDTLVAALQVFRAALEQEIEPYEARERELKALRE